MLGSTAYRLLLWLLGLGAWVMPASGANPLRYVEEDLAQRYSGLKHCEPGILAAKLRHGAALIATFDVRSLEEFDVSHVPGAIRVDPRIGVDEFVERFTTMVQGRDVLVYCSVGLRSAAFAHRLQSAMRDAGAETLSNLNGGLFRWRNEGNALVCRDGPTQQIHPFSAYWARFLNRAAMV